MSHIANKIFEALEEFSLPYAEKNEIATGFPFMKKKILRKGMESSYSQVGLRRLARESRASMVPEMLKQLRYQKLQYTTMEARKIVSAVSCPPETYRIGSVK